MAATQALRSRIEGLRRERLACSDILKKSEAIARRDQSTLANLLTEAGYAAEQRKAVSLQIFNLTSISHEKLTASYAGLLLFARAIFIYVPDFILKQGGITGFWARSCNAFRNWFLEGQLDSKPEWK